VWEPIVDGERAARAWRAIDEVGEDLAARATPAADLAVYWTYVATARDDAATEARRVRALEHFGDQLARGYESPALDGGLAGAGWVAAHVASGADELLDVVDARLLELLQPGAWRGVYDLIQGVVGFAVYLLERDSAAAARGRELAVDYFAATAERGPDGATWHRSSEHLVGIDRTDWPDGTYDCGVAHGVAGVIGVLSRIAVRPDAPPAAAPLAADATRWLLAQRRHGRFPQMIHGARRIDARAGWCYGSPGTALALGARSDLADWLDGSDTSFAGACLCHGAATLLHASNRMFQATRDPRYRGDAIAWLDRLLALDRPYCAYETGDRRYAILSGSTGAALALLAAVSDVEPGWDRQWLLDAPVL
jgi:hypothetical protein